MVLKFILVEVFGGYVTVDLKMMDGKTLRKIFVDWETNEGDTLPPFIKIIH